ncbi:MAG: alpha/beta fold hydrolase [Actinomycetota bacterium]
MFGEDVAVHSGNVELTVRDTATRERSGGERAGPALVLVHGLASNLRIWDLVASRLAPRFRVVCYDQRSHGLSGDAGGEFAFDDLVSDLEAVVDDRGLDSPVVVGHSWGASVALEYATHHPCRGVVCVDGGVFDMQAMGSTWETTEELLRPPRLIGPADEVLARIRTEQSFLPWETLEPVVLRGRVSTEDGLTRPRLRFEDHMTIVRRIWEHRTWELYERVRCPVMVVVARGVERTNRERGFVAAKELAVQQVTARRPDVRVEWLESVHDVPLANPDELAGLIEDFARVGG